MDYERRDYFRTRFTREELARLLQSVGLRPSDVVSKRSAAYRQLGLANKEVSDDELLDLMIDEPTLLRRPILVDGNNAIVGLDREGIATLLTRVAGPEE